MLKKILISKTDNIIVQIIRYGFVGGTSFLVDFGLLYFLTEFLNLFYLFSTSISFTVGLMVNYSISVLWVFTTSRFLNKFHEILIFSIIGLIGLGMNLIIMWFCTELLSIYYLISKIISTVIVFFWNFFAKKFILFS